MCARDPRSARGDDRRCRRAGAAVTQANQQVADGLVWYRGMTGELSNLAGSDLTLIPPDGSDNFAPEDWINIRTDRLGVT